MDHWGHKKNNDGLIWINIKRSYSKQLEEKITHRVTWKTSQGFLMRKLAVNESRSGRGKLRQGGDCALMVRGLSLGSGRASAKKVLEEEGSFAFVDALRSQREKKVSGLAARWERDWRLALCAKEGGAANWCRPGNRVLGTHAARKGREGFACG